MEKEAPPPDYASSSAVPGAGLRVPVISSSANVSPSVWPSTELVGPPPFHDRDGSPIYLGSAIVVGSRTSVVPGKANPQLPLHARYSYGGRERVHEGQFDVLPITADMHWVETSGGKVPKGLRPVEGGYEEDGRHLFHALAKVDGLEVPGKVGEHLSGAHVPYGGREHIVHSYRILCWR